MLHRKRDQKGQLGLAQRPVAGARRGLSRTATTRSCADQARAYAAWLSARTGYTYRLLTEAEWEYAARAGTTTRYNFGQAVPELCLYANGSGVNERKIYDKDEGRSAECADGRMYTAPVGLYRPNTFGLHDMHGNVWEWVEDCYINDYRAAPIDGSARSSTEECSSRVLRGGSWNDDPRNLRVARRNGYLPDDRMNITGFRLARTFSPTP